ncbi:MAG: hypothetical protein Kow0040_20820 [Thermogutta sp.]
MIVMTWAAWMRWSHRWIGLILLLPVAVVSGTGVLLVHESLWANKDGAKPPASSPGTPTGESAGLYPADLFPHAEAWQGRMPAFQAALEHFRAEHGDLPLREVQLRRDAAAGWVIKVKSLPTPNDRERELLWAADAGHPLGPTAGVQAYRTASGGWDWKKIVKDLHTGKLLGNATGWVWADAAGLGMIFLAVSGLLVYGKLWLAKRAQRRKAAQLRRSEPPHAPPRPPHPAADPGISRLSESGSKSLPPICVSNFVARREGW